MNERHEGAFSSLREEGDEREIEHATLSIEGKIGEIEESGTVCYIDVESMTGAVSDCCMLVNCTAIHLCEYEERRRDQIILFRLLNPILYD